MIINSCFFKNYSTVVQKNKIYRTDILKKFEKIHTNARIVIFYNQDNNRSKNSLVIYFFKDNVWIYCGKNEGKLR